MSFKLDGLYKYYCRKKALWIPLVNLRVRFVLRVTTSTKKWEIVYLSISVSECFPTCMCWHWRRGKTQENPICILFSHFGLWSAHEKYESLKGLFIFLRFKNNSKKQLQEWLFWVENGYDFVWDCGVQNERGFRCYQIHFHEVPIIINTSEIEICAYMLKKWKQKPILLTLEKVIASAIATSLT